MKHNGRSSGIIRPFQNRAPRSFGVHRFDRFQLLEMTLTMERLTFLVSQLNQVVNRLDRGGNGRWECVIS